MEFSGLVQLGNTMFGSLLTKTTSGVPINADALPTFRIYSGSGLVGTGTVSFLNSGSITGAVNNGSGLIRITSASHGLLTGDRITITGVGGVSNANGTFLITKITDDTFDLQGSTFAGTYTSGGTWNTTGRYKWTVAATAGNGYAAGSTYALEFAYAVSSGTQQGQSKGFTVT